MPGEFHAGSRTRSLTPARRSIVESSPSRADVPDWVELASIVIEVFAVGIIILGIVYATVLVLGHLMRRDSGNHYDEYKAIVGRSLLLGLEVLVAADVVRTVVLDPTLRGVGILGLLVVVRTFLSWSIILEVEGRWPWQARRGMEQSGNT